MEHGQLQFNEEDIKEDQPLLTRDKPDSSLYDWYSWIIGVIGHVLNYICYVIRLILPGIVRTLNYILNICISTKY